MVMAARCGLHEFLAIYALRKSRHTLSPRSAKAQLFNAKYAENGREDPKEVSALFPWTSADSELVGTRQQSFHRLLRYNFCNCGWPSRLKRRFATLPSPRR